MPRSRAVGMPPPGIRIVKPKGDENFCPIVEASARGKQRGAKKNDLLQRRLRRHMAHEVVRVTALLMQRDHSADHARSSAKLMVADAYACTTRTISKALSEFEQEAMEQLAAYVSMLERAGRL